MTPERIAELRQEFEKSRHAASVKAGLVMAAAMIPECLDEIENLHDAIRAKSAECCDGWKVARQHDHGCPYMEWAKADREAEWRDRAIAAEAEVARLRDEIESVRSSAYQEGYDTGYNECEAGEDI